MPDNGYFLWHRQSECNFLHPLQECRKFTKYEAWMDTVALAYFKDQEKLVRGKKVVIERGSFITTASFLADRWKWDRETVERFLTLLESENMITRSKVNKSATKSATLLKVNKYNDFQPNFNDDTAINPAYNATIRATHENKGNKRNKVSKDTLLRSQKTFKNSLPEFKAWDCLQDDAFCKWLDEKRQKLNSRSAQDRFSKEFIRLQKEKYVNWLDQKGRRQKDYVAGFRNWIIKEWEALK
jgi:hypothetical protein